MTTEDWAIYLSRKDDPSERDGSLPSIGGSRSSRLTITRSEWYIGGALHNASMSEWRNASDRNRLAISADFVAQMLDKDISVDELRPIAEQLKRAILKLAGIESQIINLFQVLHQPVGY